MFLRCCHQQRQHVGQLPEVDFTATPALVLGNTHGLWRRPGHAMRILSHPLTFAFIWFWIGVGVANYLHDILPGYACVGMVHRLF